MSKLTLVADSSQISHFLECPTLWNLGDKECLAPALAEPNEPMLMGTLGHKFLDIFYKGKANGLSMNQAMEQALAFDLNDLPECLKLSVLSVELVRQRFREYCYTYVNNDIVPLSADHIEVGFSEPIFESSDRLYVLEGRIDFMGTLQGLNVTGDNKFQVRSKQLYNKSIQFRNYAMITKTNMFLVNYIRLTKGVSKDTFVRDIASFTPVEHAVWKQRLIVVFDKMAEAILSDSYEQRWDSCAGKYGKPCVFTPLCEQWDKQLIQIKKRDHYVKKDEWKPW
jgi:hypothetical protein